MFIRSCLAIVALVGLAPSPFSQNADAVPSELDGAVQLMLVQERCQLVPDGKGVWQTSHPSCTMQARFSADGVTLLGNAGDGTTWDFGLRLVGWGRGEELVLAGDAPCTANGTRFEIQRSGLTEWYVNGESGTEQGFTAQVPPPVSADATGPLRFVLSVEDGFVGAVLDGGVDARFASEDGTAQVLYSGLRAWDAEGRSLDTCMEINGSELSLLIEENEATYPVTVDPWIWSGQRLLLVDQGSWAGECFGKKVDVSGNTAVVTATHDQSSGDRVGVAYVYSQVAGSWGLVAELRASDEAEGDRFGWSVSISGDTVLIGAPRDDDAGENSGSVYVFERNGSSWAESGKLTAGIADPSSDFGTSIVLRGDTALIGAPYAEAAGSSRGKVYVYRYISSAWSHEATLLADDGEEGDRFGQSVSLDGDFALVGAPGDDTWAENWGSAYIFARTGSTWVQQMKGTPVDGSRGGGFGYSVSLDGGVALIGAPLDYQPPSSSGAAHIFVRTGTTWVEQAKLTTPSVPSAKYGISVSLEGDVALVGASGIVDGGEAYVYAFDGTTWNHLSTFTSYAYSTKGDSFGASVVFRDSTALIGGPGADVGRSANAGLARLSIYDGSVWTGGGTLQLASVETTTGDCLGISVSVDGDTALVGAYGDDDLGQDAGAVYVPVRDGSLWTRQAKLTAADGAAGDQFGVSVSIDGTTALVGASGDDDLGAESGSTYVFVRSGSSWVQQAKLLAQDGEAGDLFGCDVALDGDTALIGAHGDDDLGLDSGGAYLFVRNGTTWSQRTKLIAPAGDAEFRFGTSVSIDDDTALVGADRSGGGRAYVFTKSGSAWMPQARLVSDDREVLDRFGTSVSIEADTAVIGASGDDDQASNAGAAYVFCRTGTAWTQHAKLVAEDGSGGDEFGESVSISDGRILVGAPRSFREAGIAHFFARSGSGWTRRAVLPGGFTVSLDGMTAIVGAPGHDEPFNQVQSGAAYLYTGSPIAHALFRNAGTNPESYTAATLPVLGTDYQAEIDLGGTTGHTLALLAGYVAPLTFTLGAGQTALVDPSGPEFLGFPSAVGPVATIAIGIPGDVAYLGFEIFTQAAHVGGVRPFALSNAQDLLIGQ